MTESLELEKLTNLFDLIDYKNSHEQTLVLDILSQKYTSKQNISSYSARTPNIFKVMSGETSFCILKRISNDTSSLNYAINEEVDSPYIVSFTDLPMTNITTASKYVWRISEELNYDPLMFSIEGVPMVDVLTNMAHDSLKAYEVLHKKRLFRGRASISAIFGVFEGGRNNTSPRFKLANLDQPKKLENEEAHQQAVILDIREQAMYF